MKKILLSLAMIALSMGIQAQESNNYKWVAGGTGSLTYNSSSVGGQIQSDMTNSRLEPFVGYNINDRWRVGLTVGMEYAKTKELDALGNLVTLDPRRTYRVGPYVHFNALTWKRWILFIEGEALFSMSPRYEVMDDNGNGNPLGGGGMPPAPGTATNVYDVTSQYFTFTIKPGITYELCDHLNIDFNLNLLGWFVKAGTEKRLDTNVESDVFDTGIMLDMLENNLDMYWRNIALGLTFKF